MAFMMSFRRASTSSRGHVIRRESCDISSPLTATPPALAALPGPYRMPASMNRSTPSGTVGMFAPSLTTWTPPPSRLTASFALISFWVALGNAHSAGIDHSSLWSFELSASWYVAAGNFSTYSRMRPRLTFLSSMTQWSFS
jgi:hypothetical protein